MAKRAFSALWFLHILCLCHLAQAGTPVLSMQNPEGDVLEGEDVTLECLSNEDEDMSGFIFQKYSKWMKTWVNLDKTAVIRCWYYDVNITREDERLQLYIKDIQPWQVGPYRCVNTNTNTNSSFDTDHNNSENFTIPFKYVRDVSIARMNVWCGTVGSKEPVEEGSDVELRCYAETDSPNQAIYEWSREGDDWIVASNVLKLNKVGKEDSGTYTCQARHPVVFSLVKSKSLELKVVTPAQGWTAKFLRYTPTSTPGLLAMFIGIPAGVLLLIILVISLVIRRRMAINRKKALIAEPEQRSPIYKGSQESLPSRTGDTQPLVI